MNRPSAFLLFFCIAFFVTSCSRKTVPKQTASITVLSSNTKISSNDSTTAIKKPAIKRIAIVTPKVIVVNDVVAKKSVDGRLYYDLEGHRYWKNYDDGKYYIFNKNMYGNNAFKPH